MRQWITICGFAAVLAFAMPSAGAVPALSFADAARGRSVLTSRDEFVANLSPFDRAARLKTDREVSEKEFLEFVGKQTLDWTPEETQKVAAAFASILPRLVQLLPGIPDSITVIKSTGNEEGSTAYTRTNAIVIPGPVLDGSASHLPKLLSHEAFHIASRADAALRERAYAAIGFQKCAEPSFPEALKARRITNPDAPLNNHCIRLEVGGKPVWAVPILFSQTLKYEPARGGEFFHYLGFGFLPVLRAADDAGTIPAPDKDNPKVLTLESVTGFYEQVGENTQYIIHPEEILADNFSLLVLEASPVPSPDVMAKIRAALTPASAPR